ncbi:hypothetical protein EH207_11180 [Brenneria rubrifaciens]|uniref:Uncharacterized protein n=1 Tax=Brenneria rubrifaciens TaxID=55213 RepID=A0A4P8QPL3_9GAMM|nr:hypothetical protein EH207_11180 [Brenneria rubrifaciens]
MVVVLVVMTEMPLPFSLLKAKAIPVREPFPCFHASWRAPTCISIQQVSVKNLPDAFLVFPPPREKAVVRFGVFPLR